MVHTYSFLKVVKVWILSGFMQCKKANLKICRHSLILKSVHYCTSKKTSCYCFERIIWGWVL